MFEIIQFSLIVIMMLAVLFIVINIPKATIHLQRINKTDVLAIHDKKTHENNY